MIDEEKQDQLIAHLLDPGAGREFEAEMAADAELASLAEELRETLGALAHTAPLHPPPPRIRARVLASARGETTAPAFIVPSKPKPQSARVPQWLPWAIAAGVAVAAVVQFAGREEIRVEANRLRADAEAARREAETLKERYAALETEFKSLASRAAQNEEELTTFKKRDALAEVRIAILKSKVTALSQADTVIVWDADQQRGIMRLSNVPKAAAGKDYQLWVIDPKYPSPVSAGVITVGTGGTAYVSFSPEKPISAANQFAISLERKGGSATPTQVVSAGD